MRLASTRGVYCGPLEWNHEEAQPMKRTLPRSPPHRWRSLAFTCTHAGQAAAPSFQVDPLWPKPLPNHWLLGSVTGVAVDCAAITSGSCTAATTR